MMRDYCPSFPGPGESEPNNSFAQANGPLCSGKDYSGLHNDADDYFRFSSAASGLITVNLTTSAPDAQLVLYDAGFVLRGHRGGPPFVITYTGPAGVYYVRVFTACTPSCPNAPYSLRVTYP